VNGTSRIWDKYKGTLSAAISATPEERRIMRSFSISDLTTISNFRYLSGLMGATMVCYWAREQGILDALPEDKSFGEEEFRQLLEEAKNYHLEGVARHKAAYSLLRILTESGHISEDVSDGVIHYRLVNRRVHNLPRLTAGEARYAERNFAGLFAFYERCLESMDDFLRVEKPSFDYTADFAHLWQGFLGNPSQLFVKRYLYRSLKLPEAGKGLQAFIIAFGQGYDIYELLAEYPDIQITTIDYVDDHVPVIREELKKRFGSDRQVEFIPSADWTSDGNKGFGVKLPLPDARFDLVIGNSFDAAIPEGRREFVWQDLTRLLKPGGKTGATEANLPREDTIGKQDKWQRLYLFSHNFIESVTSDFVGFPYFDETLSMFERLGYTAEPFGSSSLHLFNGFVWRMALKG